MMRVIVVPGLLMPTSQFLKMTLRLFAGIATTSGR